MSNLLQEFEQAQIDKIVTNRQEMPSFSSGDTVAVTFKVGEREAVYQGVCIARTNRSINSSFTVRKISFGEGTERRFPLYSPNIVKVEVLKRGRVRRAKLYYLRQRSGKSARIKEAVHGYKAKISSKEKVLASNLRAEKIQKAREVQKAKKNEVAATKGSNSQEVNN